MTEATQVANAAAPQTQEPTLAQQIRRRPERRALNAAQRVMILAGLVLGFLFVAVFVFGGGDTLGYVFARSWSDVSYWLRNNIWYFLAGASGYALRLVVAGPTITIPLATGGSDACDLVRVRYKLGSLHLTGDRYEWREGAYLATCNRRWLAKHGMMGGYFLGQEVYRHVDEDRKVITYETARVEASRSRHTEERLRVAGAQLAQAYQQLAARGG